MATGAVEGNRLCRVMLSTRCYSTLDAPGAGEIFVDAALHCML
jgi:hypothetical protein